MHPYFKSIGGLTATRVSDCQIRIERSLKAPRQLVWDAHTQPTLLKRWLLGPPGWTMTVCTIDLRIGGAYRFAWQSARGISMGLNGTYTEIAEPRRLCDRQAFDDDWTGGPYDTFMMLTEGQGMTNLSLTITYASKEGCDLAAATQMLEGMDAGYARLEAVSSELG